MYNLPGMAGATTSVPAITRPPAPWLRDNCPCAECRDPRTGQKLFQITALPAGPAVGSVREAPAADGGPGWEVVRQPDDHRSLYPARWLDAHGPGGPAYRAAGDGRTEADSDRPRPDGGRAGQPAQPHRGDWPARWFGPEVTEPVRLHVEGKRYLCTAEPGYFDLLSEASVHTLRVQGGPMTAEQAHAFEALPGAADAVAVRRCDERAEDPEPAGCAAAARGTRGRPRRSAAAPPPRRLLAPVHGDGPPAGVLAGRAGPPGEATELRDSPGLPAPLPRTTRRTPRGDQPVGPQGGEGLAHRAPGDSVAAGGFVLGGQSRAGSVLARGDGGPQVAGDLEVERSPGCGVARCLVHGVSLSARAGRKAREVGTFHPALR